MNKKIKTKNARNFWQAIKNKKGLMVFGLLSLLMFTLVSTNYGNSQNLERTELNKRIRVIEDELRLLNTNVSDLQATERIEQESQRLDLVKLQTQDIYYLDSNQAKVALK